jgi:putative ATP-binding cassette transporter
MKAVSMAERWPKSSDALATAPVSLTGGHLARQTLMIFRVLMASPQRNKILLLSVALVAVIGATAFGQIRLNAWNQPFYDALAHKELGPFLAQLMVFGVIAG